MENSDNDYLCQPLMDDVYVGNYYGPLEPSEGDTLLERALNQEEWIITDHNDTGVWLRRCYRRGEFNHLVPVGDAQFFPFITAGDPHILINGKLSAPSI